MNTKLFAAASAIVLLGLSPAMAQTSVNSDTTTQNSVNSNGSSTGSTLEKTWEKTKEAVKETTADVKDATKEAYDDVKFSLFGQDENAAATEISLNAKVTASGMLGKPVFNNNNERVATLKDIILDESGAAKTVVVSDADFIGVGAKEAAFDYSMVTKREPEGDYIMPLSEETIDQAKTFSYDPADVNKEGTVVMPTSSYSVAKMLDADVLDMQNNKVADIDNITFKEGRADKVVIGFDKVLGMGGDKAALAMSDVKIIRGDDNSVKFQISAAQAAQLESFKQKASN